MTELRPDLLACAALRQMATVCAPSAPRIIEPIIPPPRPRTPAPTCAEGGPHTYPPGRETACTVCAVTPGAAAVAGIRAAVEAHIEQAFA